MILQKMSFELSSRNAFQVNMSGFKVRRQLGKIDPWSDISYVWNELLYPIPINHIGRLSHEHERNIMAIRGELQMRAGIDEFWKNLGQGEKERADLRNYA